jgi:hypothetical protein
MVPPTSSMSDQLLARAVLRALAIRHDATESLGSLARTVLAGEASLRGAASHSWHGEALGKAFASAIDAQARMSPSDRTKINDAGRRLQATTAPEGSGERR